MTGYTKKQALVMKHDLAARVYRAITCTEHVLRPTARGGRTTLVLTDHGLSTDAIERAIRELGAEVEAIIDRRTVAS